MSECMTCHKEVNFRVHGECVDCARASTVVEHMNKQDAMYAMSNARLALADSIEVYTTKAAEHKKAGDDMEDCIDKYRNAVVAWAKAG